MAGLSAGEGLVLVLLGGEDLDPRVVPERLHGALTILELLPGRVRGRHPTVILGVRGA